MTLAVLLIPLVTAALLAFTPGVLIGRTVAALGAILTFAVALQLPDAQGVQYEWIPGFGVHFALDPLGSASVLVAVASLAMIPAVLWAGYRVTERTNAFLALLLAMLGFLNGIFLAKDLVLFYVFWEAALIPSLLMLGGWGLARRRQATMKYLVYAIAGSFLMLVSILAIRPLAGSPTFLFSDLVTTAPTIPPTTQMWLFAGFALAFAVKLPLLPLHSWLVDFHLENHPSGAADLAGSLYKVGAFGFFAWAIPLLPDGAAAWTPVLITLAAATALYAGVIATRQENLKSLLAYASLSHMGIIGVGVFSMQVTGSNGAMYFFAAQMITTGGLFLIAGMLQARTGTFDLAEYGGMAKSAPALAAVSLFVLFASIGVPGLANFPGEFLSLLGAFQVNVGAAVFATLAVIAAGVYGVNLFQRIYQGQQVRPLADLGSVEAVILIPIIAGTLWLGVSPAPQLQRIEAQSFHQMLATDTASGEFPDSVAQLPGEEEANR